MANDLPKNSITNGFHRGHRKNGRPSALAWAAICDQNGVAVTFSYSLITSLTFGLNAFNFSIDMPALQE